MHIENHRGAGRSETLLAGMDYQFRNPCLDTSGLRAAILLTAIPWAAVLLVDHFPSVRSLRAVTGTGRGI
jgi:hypothetical protein